MEADTIVNHPAHYVDNGSLLEPIDVCEWLDFSRGNAFKYVTRYQSKHKGNEVEDLKKAKWYLDRYASTCVLRHDVAGDSTNLQTFLLPIFVSYVRASKNPIFQKAYTRTCTKIESNSVYLGGASYLNFVDHFFDALYSVVVETIDTMTVSKIKES